MTTQKLTKRTYAAHKAMLDRQIAAVAEMIRDATATKGTCGESFVDWNYLHDLQDAIEDAQNALEQDWNTRNWTSADWNSYELVSQNID